jgi:hypothetical protein
MSTKNAWAGLLAILAWTGGASFAAEESADQQALLRALPGAKATLQQGLSASASHGQPISAKFEMDDGHLQLSVYTSLGGMYYEVVIDHNTGTIASAEKISEAEDLVSAKSQLAVMAKAQKKLKAAVDVAELGAPGYRAISVVPAMQKGHAFAIVVLIKGVETKSVNESLE